VAGPTLAYRLWRVRKHKSGYRLGSVGQDAWVTPGEPEVAKCEQPQMRFNGTLLHPAPARQCGCGIYGVNDVRLVTGYAAGPDDVMLVEGQVALWGHVIEHERGYQTQYAYPVRIWRREPDVPVPVGFPKASGLDDVLRRVAAEYGCEVGRP
jgi:hypothetical protein